MDKGVPKKYYCLVGKFNLFQLVWKIQKSKDKHGQSCAQLSSSYARFTSIMKLLLSSMSYIFEVHYHLLKKWDCLPLTTNNYLQPKNLFVFNRQNFGCLTFTICWGLLSFSKKFRLSSIYKINKVFLTECAFENSPQFCFFIFCLIGSN